VKILVVKRDKVGDMLLATPLFDAIKQALPKAELHVLANDYNAWVLNGNPHFDKLWIYPRLRHDGRMRPSAIWPTWRLKHTLRREKFDLAIAGGGVGSPRAIERVLQVRAKQSVAFVDQTPYCQQVKSQLTHALAWQPGVHEVDLNMQLLTACGIPIPSVAPVPELVVNPTDLNRGKTWLEQRNLKPGKFILLGIHARQPKRKPSLAQIADWSRWAYEQHGLHTVFAYQAGPPTDRIYPGDDALVAPLLAQCPPYLHPMRHLIDDFLLFGIMWHARTSVFPDGGMAHLAAASPGGVLAFFAGVPPSPPPSQWAPRGRNATFVEAKLAVAELSDHDVLTPLAGLIRNGFSATG
jgi:heptosyltransferase III